MMTFYPIVGDDGRLYFNYNQGAKIQMWDEHGEYVLEILKCEYLNGREYYQVARDGVPMLGKMTINRLTYLLNHNQITTLNIGTPCEMPLTNNEVKIYASSERRRMKAMKQKVEHQIESTGYGTLQKEYNSISISQMFAESRGDIDSANKLRLRMEEIEKQMSEIAIKEKIDLNVLEKQPCACCEDTGFINGNESLGICRCMKSQKEEIKSFCANLRK